MADVSEPLVPSRNKPSEPRAGILLVDDNPANLLTLCALLDDLGQNLVEARSGEDAIERVMADEFAVILLDVLMPGISGFETAKAIRGREQSRHTPIIFLTAGDIDRPQMEEGYALGAVDFLVKPVLPVALRAKVRGFVQLFQDKQRARHEADQLRLLVETATDYAIFMLDPQGRVATWNAGAERIKQYKADEIVGQHFTKFYPQEANDRGWPAHELKVAEAEGRFEDEGWRVRKDGTQFWANVVITALKDAHGHLRGFSKITRDMTARKQAEESARRLAEETAARRVAHDERERLHVTLASIGDAVISTDAQGRITFLNPVAQELVGWKNEEAARRSLADVFRIVNEDTRQPVENPALRALKDGVIVGLANHTVLIARDGTERPIDDSAAPIRDAGGSVVGSVLVFRDISEKKRVQRELREGEARFRGLMEQAPFSVQVFSPDGRTVRVNRAWEQLWGLTLDQIGDYNVLEDGQLEAKGVLDFIRRGFAGEVAHVPAIQYDPNETIPDRTRHQDPSRWVAAVIYPLKDGGGTIREVVLVHDDITARKRAEEALLAAHRELEQRVADRTAELARTTEFLQALLENVQTGVVACDAAGVLTLFNGVTRALHGLPQEPIPPDQWAGRYRLYRPDGETPMATADIPLFRALRGERVREAEMVIAPAGEPPRTVLSSGQAFTDAQGKLLGAVVSMHDITARRQAEAAVRQAHEELERRVEERTGALAGANAALREGEERFRQLADSMPQIVWTARPGGDIDYLNRRWHEFTGLPATVGNEGWGRILHPDDAAPATERWAASLRTGTPFEMEVRLLDTCRRTYRWHLIRTVAVRDGAGAVARWFGTATDINDQKRAEESSRYLAEASAALAGVVDYESTLQKVANLAVPYFADWSAVDVADGDGSLRRLAVAHRDADKVRLAHELMRDYPPDPQAPGGAVAVLRTGTPELVADITDEMLVQGARDERHLGLIRSLGLRSYLCVPLVVSGRPFGVLTFATAESGRTYTGADLALANDLAHRAGVAIENTRLYQALRDADRRKDEFLATLAHELRNPLAPIRNALQILKMPRVDAATVGRSRDMMERQVHQLVRLVDDLLDVSRVMRGKIELRKEQVELATVVARAVETVQPLIDAQGHELAVGLPPESLPLDADPVRLAQVVGNLLTNAAKYTEPNGHIWMTARREDGQAVLRVRDDGIGIAPDVLPHVFDLFVQVDHAAARSQGGLGIGLTLVKNLVEMHGGAVEARSAGLGKGSEFVVRLPLVAGERRQADEPADGGAQEQVRSSGHRLLVVDDNEDAADSLAMLLSLQGHEVRVAHDGPAALALAPAYRPDMVFLDIGMPGMDGYEVARRLRKTPGLEATVLAALTGWGQQEDRRRTADAGFDHHLVKPPEPNAVGDILADLKRTGVRRTGGS